jgi:hypothetical protein
MKLANRVQRMEKALGKPEWEKDADSDTGEQVSIESRVAALRRLRVRIARQFNQTPVEDPFPDLGGEEYLVAHWKWFLENRRDRWPDWIGSMTANLIVSASVDMRVRCKRVLYAHVGVADPYPRLHGKRWLDKTDGHLGRLRAEGLRQVREGRR